MIYQNTTAIDAVNNGTDTPDAFYHKSTLIATSKWHATDGWRGHSVLTPEPGYKLIEASWLTGDWSDAPADHSESEVEASTKALEAEHGNIWLIFTPTSNIFSTSYDVLVRDPDHKPTRQERGKTIAHKTRKFTDPDGSWRVRYHATDVVSYNAKTGKYTLNTGGWHSRTTHKRINEYLPSGYYVRGKNYDTLLVTPDGEHQLIDGEEV